MSPMLIAIMIGTAASAACGADEFGSRDRLVTTPTAEFSNRDKSGTIACVGVRGGSQAAENSALTSRRSFEAEGTGLEPATHCWASDFESDR